MSTMKQDPGPRAHECSVTITVPPGSLHYSRLLHAAREMCAARTVLPGRKPLPYPVAENDKTGWIELSDGSRMPPHTYEAMLRDGRVAKEPEAVTRARARRGLGGYQ